MKNRLFKNFIFDVDGTILDSRHATLEGFERLTLKHLKRPLTHDEMTLTLHMPLIEVMDALHIETTPENMAELFGHFKELSHDIKVFPGIDEVLTALKNQANFIGIASNRDKSGIQMVLNQNGLNKYFDSYVCRDHVDRPKPSGDMLVLFMHENNLNPTETIYIGNAKGDHLVAIDAGIAYAAAAWGTDEYLEEEKIILQEPTDILKLL